MRNRLIERIKIEEGFSSEPYTDIRGIWTIGYGQRVDELDVTEAEAEVWMKRRLEEKRLQLERVAGFSELDDVRRDVLLEMAYWMGAGGVLKFEKMWVAIRKRDFARAAYEMMDSRTGRDPQLGPRMRELAERMDTGRWEE